MPNNDLLPKQAISYRDFALKKTFAEKTFHINEGKNHTNFFWQFVPLFKIILYAK